MQRAQSLVITIREELLWQKKAKIMLYFNWLMKSQYDIYDLPPMPGTRKGLVSTFTDILHEFLTNEFRDHLYKYGMTL